MQHVVEEPDPRAHGDLLRRGELGGMPRILGRHDAVFRGLGFLGVFGGGEMFGSIVGRENAAVEGERDLDLGLVGDARDRRGSLGEGHCG